MSGLQRKSWLTTLAMVGMASVIAITNGCSRDRAERSAYEPPDQPAIERSTTASGTTDPGALESLEQNEYAHNADLTDSDSVVRADFEQTLEFDSVNLTDASKRQLEQVISSLDPNKTLKVIVAMDQAIYQDELGGSDNVSARESELKALYTMSFTDRVDSIKVFLEEHGLAAAQWQFERMEEQDLARQRNAQEDASDIQSIRLVISGSSDAASISGLDYSE